MRKIYRLDYELEMEHASRRAAAQCAAYARLRSESLTSKLLRAAKGMAFIYLAHLSLKAHEGVFTQMPPALAAAQPTAPSGVRALLGRLTGVRLSRAFAQDVWPQMLEHKWYLSERLGRDVGLRVAAVDFFENVFPLVPYADESGALPPRLPMMLRLGERLGA